MIRRLGMTGFLVVTMTMSESFTVPVTRTENLSLLSKLDLFKGLSDAFKNDDTLGKPKDAGLTGGPKYNEQVRVVRFV